MCEIQLFFCCPQLPQKKQLWQVSRVVLIAGKSHFDHFSNGFKCFLEGTEKRVNLLIDKPILSFRLGNIGRNMTFFLRFEMMLCREGLGET